MMTVPLYGRVANGRIALVDDEDFDLASRHRWHALERKRPSGSIWGPYAGTNIGGRANHRVVLLHRLLMPGIPEVDHEDGDGLNCQRSNLRPASRSQNNANARKRIHRDGPTSSRWKGVSWREGRGRWRAYIVLDGRQHYLGFFADEVAAAQAYDAAARQMFGEFARLNFPGQCAPAPLPDAKNMYPHVCEMCSGHFTSARANCRFCSDRCRANSNYRTR